MPKLDQIAYVVTDAFPDAALRINNMYGTRNDWIHDEVIAKGHVESEPRSEVTNIAHLAFNYSHGLEIELIRYKSGANFHQLLDTTVRMPISHLGMHLEEAEWQTWFDRYDWAWPLVQHVHTFKHTNNYLIERGRTYEYAIFDTRPDTGTFTKLIRRIERGSGVAATG